MKRVIRVLIFLLALATVLPIVACVTPPVIADTTVQGQTDPQSTIADDGETTEPEAPVVILTEEMTEAPDTTQKPETAAPVTEPPATETEGAIITEAPDTAPDTDAATTEAPDTAPDDTDLATTTEAPETKPVTTEETKPVTTAKPKEKTAAPKKASCQPVNDGKVTYILIYCEVEEFSTVYVCDKDGHTLIKESAYGPLFYGRYLLEAGTSKTVYIYAKAEGKTLSGYTPLVLKYNSDGSVGNGAFVGKDSKLYYTGYDSFYKGDQVVSAQRMADVKGYLENKLANVRAQTGKNTKIIMIICTNPATIYHDRQYAEAEGGRGDYFKATPTTQFAEYMKNNSNIIVIDLRDILMEHRDEAIICQCDSHWTSVAGYYAYYSMLQYIKKDYSGMPTLKLSDCNITYGIGGGGGDLLSFTGGYGKGMKSWGPSVAIKNPVTLPSNAPTAYVMGDSYYWAISGYLKQAFKEVYLNNPASNPPLYDYSLNDLATKKPDYLVYMWTERNVDGNLGIMVN